MRIDKNVDGIAHNESCIRNGQGLKVIGLLKKVCVERKSQLRRNFGYRPTTLFMTKNEGTTSETGL